MRTAQLLLVPTLPSDLSALNRPSVAHTMPSGNCDHFEATALNNNAYRNIRAKRQLAPSDQRNPRGSLATGLERSNDRFVATRRSFAHRALRFLEQPPVDALLVELVEARHDLQSVSVLEITQAHHT